jgi:hypothetical protein
LGAMFTISAEGEDSPSHEMLGVIYEFLEGLKVDMTSPFTNKEAKE